MFQSAAFELARLEHHHGGDSWHDMVEVSASHDSAESDPERQWVSGSRIFRCTTCEDEIRVVGPDPSPIEGARASSFEGTK
jgi:hypothetical protein